MDKLAKLIAGALGIDESFVDWTFALIFAALAVWSFVQRYWLKRERAKNVQALVDTTRIIAVAMFLLKPLGSTRFTGGGRARLADYLDHEYIRQLPALVITARDVELDAMVGGTGLLTGLAGVLRVKEVALRRMTHNAGFDLVNEWSNPQQVYEVVGRVPGMHWFYVFMVREGRDILADATVKEVWRNEAMTLKQAREMVANGSGYFKPLKDVHEQNLLLRYNLARVIVAAVGDGVKRQGPLSAAELELQRKARELLSEISFLISLPAVSYGEPSQAIAA